tara:strand:- start:785 stop:1075 length:291 start_codon:yes stop_codon:yes gene_type:complete
MKKLCMIEILAILASLLGSFGFVEIVSTSQAEMVKPTKTIKIEYQYAAKVACSLLLPHQDGTLVKGTYRTIVNIHNATNKKNHYRRQSGACSTVWF